MDIQTDLTTAQIVMQWVVDNQELITAAIVAVLLIYGRVQASRASGARAATSAVMEAVEVQGAAEIKTTVKRAMVLLPTSARKIIMAEAERLSHPRPPKTKK